MSPSWELCSLEPWPADWDLVLESVVVAAAAVVAEVVVGVVTLLGQLHWNNSGCLLPS